MKIFVWFRQHQTTINGILLTTFASLLFNIISSIDGCAFNTYADCVDFYREHFWSCSLIMLSSFLFCVLNILYLCAAYQLNKKSLSMEFPVLMKKYTSPQLAASLGNGCLSWGEGKTLEICNEIIFGWNPKNILIEEYDDEIYKFFEKEESKKKFGEKSYCFNTGDYLGFKETDQFQKIIRKGNNLPRFMLKKCSKNYDKHNRKLLLSLGRTEWSQCSYVWDKFGKSRGDEYSSNDLMKEYSGGVRSGDRSDPYLPNSFCMHLLIESQDNKVVLALISDSKRNDNPGTWAVTLGEQLEQEDFTDGNNFHESFVVKWMRRAFQEEYKLDEAQYEDLIDESSLRCISVDFESDRYNFALFCVVRLRYSFENFYEKVKVLLSTDEATRLSAISLDEIPKILVSYKDENARRKYHPSSYLRLLLFYIHKFGYSRTEKLLLEYDKNL